MTVSPGTGHYTSLLGDHSEREPPDPIPNSEVKPLSADDSAAVCRAKVGNRQAPNPSPSLDPLGFFMPGHRAIIVCARHGRIGPV